MKTSRVIQLVIAGALAAGLNGFAAAQPIHLTASATANVASISDVPSSLYAKGAVMPSPAGLTTFHHGDFDDLKHPGSVSCVPEPSVYFLMLAGVGLIGFMSYRRQRNFMPSGQTFPSA